jgi:hypothetical protein
MCLVPIMSMLKHLAQFSGGCRVTSVRCKAFHQMNKQFI